jgi:excisionase family DNA binding protein
MEMGPLLRPEDVAGILGISTRMVQKLARERKLASIQISPKERRFRPEQVEEFIMSRVRPRPQPVDRKASSRVVLNQKGGAKSVEDSGTDLGKEIRELCR